MSEARPLGAPPRRSPPFEGVAAFYRALHRAIPASQGWISLTLTSSDEAPVEMGVILAGTKEVRERA